MLTACWREENQNATNCQTNPGCHWEDGMEDGMQMWEPSCYFDCWGLTQADCQNSALVNECQWKLAPQDEGFCMAPSSISDWSECEAFGGESTDAQGNTVYTYCWGFEDWETGTFNCECMNENSNWDNLGQAACESTTTCVGCQWKTAESGCEWQFVESTCDGYGWNECDSALSSENCEWDFEGGYCYQTQGADCWSLHSAS